MKMIGIAFDCYDGSRKKAAPEKSDHQVENELIQLPTLLEILGHTFILSTYFYGPQASLAKYRRALERNSIRRDLPDPSSHIFQSLTRGTMFMAAYFIMSKYPPSIDDVKDCRGFVRTLAVTYWWTLVITWRYAGAFYMSEGASMLSGVAYNGEKKVNGTVIVDWSGCRNIDVYKVSSPLLTH